MRTANHPPPPEAHDGAIDVVRIARTGKHPAAGQLRAFAADLSTADKPEPRFFSRFESIDRRLSDGSDELTEHGHSGLPSYYQPSADT